MFFFYVLLALILGYLCHEGWKRYQEHLRVVEDGWTLVGWRRHGIMVYEFRFKNGVVTRGRDYYPSGRSTAGNYHLWYLQDALEQQIEWGKLKDLEITSEDDR